MLRSGLMAIAGLAIAAVLHAGAGVAGAAAAPKQFLAVLNGSQEVPPNATGASGNAHFTYTDATKTLCFSIVYSGLSSAEVSAHLHGPALPDAEAPILYGLPLGADKKGCIAPLLSAEKSSLFKNQLYVNVHSVGLPLGELRGQILRIK